MPFSPLLHVRVGNDRCGGLQFDGRALGALRYSLSTLGPEEDPMGRERALSPISTTFTVFFTQF